MKKSWIIIFITICIGLLVFFISEKINERNENLIEIYTEPLLMINGKLYYGTEEIGPMGDGEAVEGKILSTVERDKIPTENGQSNFGAVGNPYTYDFGDGWIMVLMEDQEYHIFYEKTY